MIRKLEQLTVARFVDLLCGDMTVLTEGRTDVTEAEATAVLRSIVMEYKEITDKAGVAAYLDTVERLSRARMECTLYGMLHNLVRLGEHDGVRSVLEECGVDASAMTDRRVEVEVKSRLARARGDVKRIGEEQGGAGDGPEGGVRRMFDAQTASMMAWFRFQIDTSSMPATQYAHLVARQASEVKARMAAMKR